MCTHRNHVSDQMYQHTHSRTHSWRIIRRLNSSAPIAIRAQQQVRSCGPAQKVHMLATARALHSSCSPQIHSAKRMLQIANAFCGGVARFNQIIHHIIIRIVCLCVCVYSRTQIRGGENTHHIKICVCAFCGNRER